MKLSRFFYLVYSRGGLNALLLLIPDISIQASAPSKLAEKDRQSILKFQLQEKCFSSLRKIKTEEDFYKVQAAIRKNGFSPLSQSLNEHKIDERMEPRNGQEMREAQVNECHLFALSFDRFPNFEKSVLGSKQNLYNRFNLTSAVQRETQLNLPADMCFDFAEALNKEKKIFTLFQKNVINAGGEEKKLLYFADLIESRFQIKGQTFDLTHRPIPLRKCLRLLQKFSTQESLAEFNRKEYSTRLEILMDSPQTLAH